MDMTTPISLNDLKTTIDRWEDGYLTGRNDSEQGQIMRALDAEPWLIALLDRNRQTNLTAMNIYREEA
jgi:hypothetical protein